MLFMTLVGLAPGVFVAAHFCALIRYDMLAGNVRRFREDLAVMVRSEEDRDRCRQLLANVEFGTLGGLVAVRWSV
jgi:hypothetical protein